jgi:hypothetical protein
MPLSFAPTRLAALCAVAAVSLAVPAGASAKKTASPKLPGKFQKRYHVKSATADPDRDGLTNYTEYRAHTNPKKKDTTGNGKPDSREDADHDGLNNLAEQNTANDPGDPDSDDDGIKDGNENAGQILSFGDDGVLSLRLASTGKVVSALVDEDTAFECSATEDYETSYDDSAADDTQAVDEGDDVSSDDTSSDDSGDVADDSGDDSADASAASVRRADDGDDAGDDSGDAGDDTGSNDCADQYLDAGAWVHESTLITADDGTRLFDAVALVSDDQ